MENNIFSFSATETGYNHLKVSKVCEDASDFYDDKETHIGVIADGHGSDNYPRTDRGARFAVDAAIRCIAEFIENADPRQVIEDERHNYTLLTQLAKSILRDWYQAVENDYNKHPFEESELEKVSDKYRKRYLSEKESERRVEKAYGCTLIAFAVTEEYSFGLQIGDGKCVVINQCGDFTEPIPWDDDCQMNVTTSICDSDAIDEFRFCVFNNAPAAVFCGSDGIDDSYANSEEMYALYRSILKIFIEHGIEVGKSEIKEYLPVLTKRGSGDDVSVATIIDFKKITELAPIFEIQASLFNLSAELESKKRKLTVTGEKMDALYKKNRDFSRRDGRQQDTEQGLYNLVGLSNQLKAEIDAAEQQIAELKKERQELIYDMETASFDESADESNDVVSGVQIEDNKIEESTADNEVETDADASDSKGTVSEGEFSKNLADVEEGMPLEATEKETAGKRSKAENFAIETESENICNDIPSTQQDEQTDTADNTAF